MKSLVLKFCISFLCVCLISASKIDFCSENVFNSSLKNNYLQFTKELSSSEYALTSTFKSLHCCARGYRSIQWFKDGKPYPWSSEVSTFILYPDAANQTIYARSLATVHSGNYTCQVSNDSQTISHTIKFNVFGENGYSDNPLSTYNLPAEQYVKLGDTARLYCEAFIGKINLPDAESDIFWTRPGMNETQVLKNPRVHIKYVPRDDEQIIGLYFYIENVKRSDLGEYICHVSNSNDQETVTKTTLFELDWNGERRNFDVPWLKVILIISLILALFIFIVSVFQHVFLSILLFFKSSCCSSYNESGKVYDILVCYMSSDTDFIKTTLAVTLQKKYGYSVSYKQLIDPNLAPTASQSRCILLIGSPGMCNNEWTPKSIHALLNYMTSMSNNVIFVPVKPIPSGELLKSDDGRKLEEILKKISVVQFYGNSKSDMRMFWIKLRLALPSKKRNFQIPSVTAVSDQLVQSANQSVSTKVNFLMLTKSKDGAEVLV